jgi:predicted nucleotidyltransferase
VTDGLTEKERAGIRAVLASCPRIERALLFGSRAIGTFRPTSDVDLALEGEDLRLEDVIQLTAQIAALHVSVDPDLTIRAAIKNPDLEAHIRDHGYEWYRRVEPVAGADEGFRSGP